MFEYNPFRLDPVEPERVYRALPLRAVARGLHARRAQLSRAELAEPPDRARRRRGLPRARSSSRWLKQRAPRPRRATWKVIASDMPLSLVVPDLNRTCPRAPSRRGPTATTARRWGASSSSPSCSRFIKNNAHPQRGLGDRRRPLRAGDPLRPGARAVHRLRAVLGVRRRAAQRRHLRARPRSTRPSGRTCEYRELPAGMKQNRPPSEGLQFFGTVRHRRRHRGHDRLAARHRGPNPLQDRPEPRVGVRSYIPTFSWKSAVWLRARKMSECQDLTPGLRRRSSRSRRFRVGSPPARAPPPGSPAPPAGSRAARCARRGRWSPPRRRG